MTEKDAYLQCLWGYDSILITEGYIKKPIIIIIILFSLISFQTFGQTWSGLTRLTWNAGDSLNPSIATDSGSGIHVVWQDDTPGNDEIFYKPSSNTGATWSTPTRLTWGASYESEHPSIATDSGSGIHVVWQDKAPGDFEILYKYYK